MKRAFTLIELLVVIAIIGILTGIVLVSLGGARTRARDARIKSDFAQIRSGAEVYYDQTGSYSGFGCTTNTPVDIASLCTDITNNGGGAPTISAGDDAYCAYAKLNSGTYYCIASNGKSVETPTDPGTGACGGGSYDCP